MIATVSVPDSAQIEYRFVSIGDMFRPAGLQRPMDEKHVQRIVDGWNEAAFSAPILSYREHGNRGPRGETYAIVSGQHRMEAARRVGKASVFCAVVYGLDAAGEARLFIDEDRRKQQSTLQKFHLARQSGDAAAIAIWDIVNKHGFLVAKDTGDKTRRAIRGTTELYKAYRRGTLDATLRIIAAAFDYDPKGNQREIIAGLSLLLAYRPGMDEKRLASRMGVVGPQSLMTRYAHARAAAGSQYRDAAPLLMANVIVDVYNIKLRDNAVGAVQWEETRKAPPSAVKPVRTSMPLAEARAAVKAGLLPA